LIRIRRSLFYPLRFLFTIFNIIYHGYKADVIYLNGLVFEGIIASKLIINKPVVIKVVGDLIWEKAINNRHTTLSIDTFQNAKHGLRICFLRRLQSWYTSKADVIITPSYYLKKIVTGWGVNENNVVVIYNSINLKNYNSTINLKSKKKYDVITVARLVPWKGIDSLIKVCILNKWRLRIVGDGPLRSQLQELTVGSKGLVSFSGNLPHANVQAEIRRSKVFVLNSSYEGLPHIVIEAKACGVPVIATSVGGTPETIDQKQNGILIPEGETGDLIEAIKKVLSSERTANFLITKAFKQIQEKFSFDVMKFNTKKVFLMLSNK
jgi:glycosyltransferase involved in cell wall biosynthesis